MKMKPFLAIASIIAGCCVVSAASAQDPNDALMQACGPDIQKFCADVAPGNGQIAACLKSHRSDLSKDCRKAARAARKAKDAE
jgi:hypothetical protein